MNCICQINSVSIPGESGWMILPACSPPHCECFQQVANREVGQWWPDSLLKGVGFLGLRAHPPEEWSCLGPRALHWRTESKGRDITLEQADPNREETAPICHLINQPFCGEGSRKVGRSFFCGEEMISKTTPSSSHRWEKLEFGQSGCHLWALVTRTNIKHSRDDKTLGQEKSGSSENNTRRHREQRGGPREGRGTVGWAERVATHRHYHV